jgi:hypothetical protein
MEAVEVKATCRTMVAQPEEGGRCRRKKRKTRPKKRSMERRQAQFVVGPRWRQAGAVLLSLRIPRNHGNGSQGSVDPVHALQTPRGSIQPDDAGMHVGEMHGQFEQGTGKAGIMGIGWPDQEVHGQAGAATEQRMHALAPQERTQMVSRSVPQGRIRIGSAPRQDGSTLNDQITSA